MIAVWNSPAFYNIGEDLSLGLLEKDSLSLPYQEGWTRTSDLVSGFDNISKLFAKAHFWYISWLFL